MTQSNRTKIVGITGGVGSGKSAVLSYLEDTYGATAFYADLIARDLEEPGQVCYQKILDAFGYGILAPDECIDRDMLASVVYTDKEKLDQLNAIVHPAVKEEIWGIIRILDGKVPFFAVEAALLFESHYDEFCDETWYVFADETTRRERLKISRNYDPERISEIMSNQLQEEEFRRRCDRVIDNGKDFSQTKEQIDQILASSSDLW